MSGRQSARTRHVSAKATIPGDLCSKPQSPYRVRNAGEELPSEARSGSRRTMPVCFDLKHTKKPVCRLRKRHTGCSHERNAGAAGAALRPVVPHTPFVGKKEQE